MREDLLVSDSYGKRLCLNVSLRYIRQSKQSNNRHRLSKDLIQVNNNYPVSFGKEDC